MKQVLVVTLELDVSALCPVGQCEAQAELAEALASMQYDWRQRKRTVELWTKDGEMVGSSEV